MYANWSLVIAGLGGSYYFKWWEKGENLTKARTLKDLSWSLSAAQLRMMQEMVYVASFLLTYLYTFPFSTYIFTKANTKKTGGKKEKALSASIL